jgi:hypothetical protein
MLDYGLTSILSKMLISITDIKPIMVCDMVDNSSHFYNWRENDAHQRKHDGSLSQLK